MTEKVGLRETLQMPSAPDFVMELPPGWSRRDPSPETLAELSSTIKSNLMKAHQPQTYSNVERLLREAFDGMRRAGAFAFFAPVAPPEGVPMTTASIVARIRRSEDGQSLDAVVRNLIRAHGATPLFGDKRTLRHEQEENIRIEGETFVSQSVTYLIPVPGAARRRALELLATVVRPVGTPADAPGTVAQINLIDLCVSSLRWVPDVSGDD